MTLTVHDFTTMSSFPVEWDVYTNNTSYAFGKGGLTVTPTGTGYHWMFAAQIPASGMPVIRLRIATPPPSKFYLGWMAQGHSFGTAYFGVKIEETGELVAHAGETDQASGITYNLSQIKAVYVQKPTSTEIKVCIELTDGTLDIHVLSMPAAGGYNLDEGNVGFLVYVKDWPSKLVLSHLALSSQQLIAHAFRDPKRALVNLLSDNWAEKMVDFTPRFSTDWYDRKEDMPQVVVSHIITPSRFLGIGQTPKRFDADYAIDVWSKGDNAKRWKMIGEIDRILLEKQNDPGTDLDFVQVSNWRDLDEVDVTPKLFRSRLHVRLLYFKS